MQMIGITQILKTAYIYDQQLQNKEANKNHLEEYYVSREVTIIATQVYSGLPFNHLKRNTNPRNTQRRKLQPKKFARQSALSSCHTLSKTYRTPSQKTRLKMH